MAARRGPYSEIYRVVRAIPRGRVATYGEVAELSSLPRGHRVAARALKSCPENLPWYRVVGKQDARRARLNIGEPEHARLQRARLEAEGVAFDAGGFIPLARFGWLHQQTLPERRARRTTRRRPR
jgi:methylated-DNA-protein-cysteine methyltransferase-like protein